jgi:hypothetical protein
MNQLNNYQIDTVLTSILTLAAPVADGPKYEPVDGYERFWPSLVFEKAKAVCSGNCHFLMQYLNYQRGRGKL